MNYSELLHDFLEGSLPAGESQEALFAALSRDADLRSEMQQMLRMSRAVKNDVAAFTPPAEAKSEIFARLGFRPPVVGGESVASAVSSSALGRGTAQQAAAQSGTIQQAASKIRGALWWREILLSSFAASLATGILLLLFARPYMREMATEFASAARNEYNSGAPPVNFHAKFAGENPGATSAGRDTVRIVREIVHVYHGAGLRRGAGVVVSSVASEESLKNPASALLASNAAASETIYSLHRSLRETAEEAAYLRTELAALREELRKEIREEKELRLAAQNASQSQSQSENQRDSKSQVVESQTITPQGTATPPSVLRATPEEDGQSRPTARISAPEPSEEKWYRNLSLSVRGIQSRSLPQATVPSNAERFPFPNVVASVLYKISDNEEIGVEAGQEAYAQRFRSVNADGVPFFIDQNPTLSFAGVAYRYTLFPESMLSPFVHGVVGGADVGLTGRLLLGLRFQPDARTQFILGAESSALVYGHQGVWYATPNIGFTYGVSIRF